MSSISCVSLMVATFVVLLSCCFLETQAAFLTTIYTTELTGDFVAPSLGPPGRYGLAVCEYDRNAQPPTMYCQVQHNLNVAESAPLQVIVYRGGAGTIGSPVYVFDNTNSSFVEQTFLLVDKVSNGIVTYSIDQQENDFLNGNWYIQINSVYYVYGEMRGNLNRQSRFFSRLNSTQVVDPNTEELISNPSSNTGIAIASYSWFNPRRTLTFQILHNVFDAIDITLNMQVADTDTSYSPAVRFLPNWLSPVLDTVVQLGSAYQEERLFGDDDFLQVSSGYEETSDIRGELISIDYMPPASFTARLDGLSVRPLVSTTARGCAIVSFNCVTRSIEYLIFHSVINPTLGQLRVSDNKTSHGIGSLDVIHRLPRAKSPIYGSTRLNPEQINLLLQERLAFSISSDFYPAGEIRGAITTDYPLYSYLSGVSVVPTGRSTSALGCATFRLMEVLANGTQILDFDILHNVPLAIAVELNDGPEGSTGTLYHTFSTTPQSPVSGIQPLLDPRRARDISNGLTFLQVRSERFFQETSGELRGQINHIVNFPCSYPSASVTPTPFFPPSPTNFTLPPLVSVSVDLAPSVVQMMMLVALPLLLSILAFRL